MEGEKVGFSPVCAIYFFNKHTAELFTRDSKPAFTPPNSSSFQTTLIVPANVFIYFCMQLGAAIRRAKRRNPEKSSSPYPFIFHFKKKANRALHLP